MKATVRRTLALGLIALLLVAVVVPAVSAQAVTPSVTVNDQEIQDGTVTVATIVSDGPGWMVIHADNNGAPGPVIGHTAVMDGENTDVVVDIDVDAATETLYAMLHSDLGTVGTYEFPGADTPAQADGQVVMSPFSVTGLLTMEPETLPQTGGASRFWTPIAMLGGTLSILIAAAYLFRSRQSQKSRGDK
ncbi:MAG: hypothetical protein A2Y73_07070 [Chloroflexi bacterium RBG_13_56_8]|nr:MAG: hypothetical protein A2Y73_07070 [Chloroflexi bacterium RBG_13_56_8]